MPLQGDFHVINCGSIVTFRPLTEDGEDWWDDNVDPDAVCFGGAFAVDHRYAGAILEGISADGLLLGGTVA